MTIIELLEKVGVETLFVNFIQENMTSIKTRKGGLNEISFVTKELTPNDVVAGRGPIGVVVWIPRDKWPLKEQP